MSLFGNLIEWVGNGGHLLSLSAVVGCHHRHYPSRVRIQKVLHCLYAKGMFRGLLDIETVGAVNGYERNVWIRIRCQSSDCMKGTAAVSFHENLSVLEVPTMHAARTINDWQMFAGAWRRRVPTRTRSGPCGGIEQRSPFCYHCVFYFVLWLNGFMDTHCIRSLVDQCKMCMDEMYRSIARHFSLVMDLLW